MEEYPNWFIQGKADINFKHFLTSFAGQELHYLQIGAFTGDATEWLFTNVLTNPASTLTDVDTWEGSDEPAHKELDWLNVEETYDLKTKSFQDSGQLIKKKMTSDEFFAQNDKKFDFIYIDGNHQADIVLRDGINSIKCLNPGGFLAFDDYMWTLKKGPEFDPSTAIDAIRSCYRGQLEELHFGLQGWFRMP